jgi:hypothetical protein
MVTDGAFDGDEIDADCPDGDETVGDFEIGGDWQATIPPISINLDQSPPISLSLNIQRNHP